MNPSRRKEEMRQATVSGKYPIPFDCPYCNQSIDAEETADPKCNWEILEYSRPDGNELDAMDCPHCGKRFKLLQTFE